MAGNFIKSEPSPDSVKTEVAFPPGLKAEIDHLVRTAVSQMHAEYAESVVKPQTVQAQHQAPNDATTTLKAELASAKKQAQDIFHLMNTFKSQLDSQSVSYTARIQQLEQQNAALSKQEASLRASYAQLQADRDAVVQAQKQLTLAHNELTARNRNLSSQFADAQNEYAIKVAELNDATYSRSRLEQRLLQTTKENEYWRKYYSMSTSTSTQGGPPHAVHFSVPQMPNRRNTVPDTSSVQRQYAPFTQSDPTESRGVKRPRTESTSSSGAIDVVDLTVTSPTSESFRLRPVRPPKSLDSIQTSRSLVVSQPDPSSAQAIGAPSFVLPRLSVPVVPAPAPPATTVLEPMSQQGSQSAPPHSAPQSLPAAQPTNDAIPASSKAISARQLLHQLFPVSATGQRVCKLCKTRPEGVEGAPLLSSASPAECVAHARKYHTKVLSLLNTHLAQLA